jgi:cell division protein FtsB
MPAALFLRVDRPLLAFSSVMTARRKLLWGAVALAAVLTAVSAFDAKGFRHYLKLQEDMNSLSQRNARVSEQNRAMAKEIDALRNDPKALERAAREELGFIRPGEVIINLE